MKTNNVLAAITFMLAMGSAFASEYLVSDTAWTRKTDVPAQQDNCEQRTICSGGQQECMILIDHDGNPETDDLDVQLYDETCVTPLFKN